MKKYILYTIPFVLLFACVRNQNRYEAIAQLAEIEQLVVAKKYNTAMIALDSFHINFQKMTDLRRKALVLEDTISLRQNRKIIAFCDSMLVIRTKALDSLRTFFRLEKNEKYQAIGNFVYKNQTQSNSVFNNFIQTYVDENTDFYIFNTFYGGLPKNSEILLTVFYGDIYASTDTVLADNPARHRFEVDGGTVETLTLKNEQIEQFAAFINQFSDKNLTVRFGQAGKYQLSENNKHSISITYQLWKLQKEIENLTLQKEKAIKKSIAVLSPSIQNQ